MTTAPGDDNSPDVAPAAPALLPFATVGLVVPLIISRPAFGVNEIGNRRAAHNDGLLQNFLQSTAQCGGFLQSEFFTGFCGMDSGGPQTFVGVDVSDAAEHSLIEQESFDARFAAANAFSEFLFAYQQRFSAESLQLLSQRFVRQVGHTTKSARVGVAQFPPIIEGEHDVGVFFEGLAGKVGSEISGHTKMHEKRLRRWACGALAR